MVFIEKEVIKLAFYVIFHFNDNYYYNQFIYMKFRHFSDNLENGIEIEFDDIKTKILISK